MKKLIFILFTLCSVAAFGQVTSLNDAVRNNTLSPARVANALDASKAFEALGTDTYTTSILTGVYTAYTSGDVFKITFTNANTGAATLNINSLGAIAIRDNSGTALDADAIVAGGTYILRYNGTHFRIVGATGAGGGGGIELQTKTETGTTYTVTDADHFYRINFTNASGCDVTFGDGVTAGTYVVLRRVSGAGDIQAVAGGTGVLNAYNDDYTIQVEDGEAAWFKRDGTNWDGSGYLGASGAATWGSISGTLSDQTDLQTALDAKKDIEERTAVTLANGVTAIDFSAGDVQALTISENKTISSITNPAIGTIVLVLDGTFSLEFSGITATIEGEYNAGEENLVFIFCKKVSGGAEYRITFDNSLGGVGEGVEAFAALTEASPTTWATTKAVSNKTLTLTADRTFDVPSGMTSGWSGNVLVTASGAQRILTIPAGATHKMKGVGDDTTKTITIPSGQTYLVSWLYDGTNFWWWYID